MGIKEAKIIHRIVSESSFHTAVDLGCGCGFLGQLIKGSVGYLIGVDKNEARLKKAGFRGVYDELVHCDIRDYKIPRETEAAFLCEVIEHINLDEGMKLLSRLQDVPVIVITTPSKFSNPCLNDGHRSLWTIQHFETQGFKTQFYRRNVPMELIYGEGIVALKGPESLQQRMIQAVLEHNRTEPVRIEGTSAHAMTDLMVLLMIMKCSSRFLDDVLERLWNAQIRSKNKQPDFFDVFRQYPTGKLLIRDHGREFK